VKSRCAVHAVAFLEYWRTRREHGLLAGRLHLTGDRAYRDEQGYSGSSVAPTDVIISAGYRIGPSRWRARCSRIRVLESAVVASPDAIAAARQGIHQLKPATQLEGLAKQSRTT